ALACCYAASPAHAAVGRRGGRSRGIGRARGYGRAGGPGPWRAAVPREYWPLRWVIQNPLSLRAVAISGQQSMTRSVWPNWLVNECHIYFFLAICGRTTRAC